MKIDLKEKKIIMGKALFFTLMLVTAVFWVCSAWMVFYWVPSDSAQGIAQRIFYYHVPTAWVSFLGFGIALYYSIRYLISRDLDFDSKAASNAITGWVFTTGVIITGPLWAKPIWGDFWNWKDQRLVSFFVLWLLYAGYLLLRSGVTDPHKKARFSSVLGILASLNVPLVYLAIRIWNTPVHPAAVFAGEKKSGLMDPKMRITFLFSTIAFTLLFFIITHLFTNFLQQEKKLNEKRGN